METETETITLTEKPTTKLLRNGDVLFKPVDEAIFGATGIPVGAKKIQSEVKNFAVAYGEVTGHSHVVKATTPEALFNVWETENGKRFIEVLGGDCEVVHEEHYRPEIRESRTLPPGIYEIGQETEYDPYEQTRRSVVD